MKSATGNDTGQQQPGRTRPDSNTTEPKDSTRADPSPEGSSLSPKQTSLLVMLPHTASASARLLVNF